MQVKYIKERKKGKHLTEVERAKIETLLKEKRTKAYIEKEIGVSERTIYREIKRGMVRLIDSELREKRVYVYDVAQNRYEENQRKKIDT